MYVAFFSLLILARLAWSADQCGWNPQPASTPRRHPTCPALLDEQVGAKPHSWTPWTHPPYCAGSPYCVYTNAVLPKRDGISIITTPKIAATSMSLYEHTLDMPFSDPSKVFDEPPYELRVIPGKGKGAVATRKIAKEMVIMIDPAIMMATVEYPAEVTHEQVQDILHRGAEQLKNPDRIFGLAQIGAPGVSAVEDVLITNSFGVSVNGSTYMGLFPELSRLNHGCHPNAFTHFSEISMAMTVWSSHNIEPGEEITVSYADFALTYAERQKALHDVWGFTCECALCSAGPDERAASDQRREKIRKLRPEVIHTINRGEFGKAVGLSEELLALVEEEDLLSHYGDYFEIPARLYNAVGNLEKAEEYTRLVLKELQGYGMPSDNEAAKIEKFTKLLDGILKRKARR